MIEAKRLVRFLLVLVSLAALPAMAAEALVNGGFETGVTPWVESSTAGYPIITEEATIAHSGAGYAWLGGYESGTDILSQDVTIPADAGAATLHFWRLINVDAQSFTVSDTMTVRITDVNSGQILANLVTFSNLDVTGDWVPTPEYDVSVFRGRTVRLQFIATNDAFNVTSFLVDDVTLTYGPSAPRLANISTRGQVLTGNDVMIAGFVIDGSAAKTVVINVAGPSLVPFGISNALMNPTLTLVRSSDSFIMGTNDDWQSAGNAAQIRASGFAPSNSLEPAIMISLAPGAYTAIVQGAGGTTGVGLVGVFEVDQIESPLINISTRGQVLTGNDVMIAGFIIRGSNPQTVVINVAGPSLVPFGITNALVNPTLTLVRSSDQATLKTNDDWQTQTIPGDVAAIQATGFQPNNSAEPAIIATLPPGAYTAIVRGAGGGTGVGLVGVFAAP